MDQIHLIRHTPTSPSESAHDLEEAIRRQRQILAALLEVLAASEALLADMRRQ